MIGIAASLFAGCSGGNKPVVNADKLREYAGDLINKGLYSEAIDAYQQYLDDYKMDDSERANINYIIANTYFEREKDYSNALASYLKIKHLFPQESLMPEVNKKIVACLERLERTEDAQQALDESVQLDPSQVHEKRPGAVLARIGNREITQGDLDFELSQLPPMVREQFKAPEKKLDFLRDYVATELMYDTAKRSGLDNDKDVVEGAFQAKKALMVRKLLEQRVADKINLTDDEIKLYYQAHKDDYAEKDKNGNVTGQKPLSEVQQQVQQALSQQKYQQAYRELVEKMLRAEGVNFYESRIQ